MNGFTLAALAGALIATYAGGYIAGYTRQSGQFAEYKAQVEVVQHELREKAEQQRLVSERISKDTADGWSHAVAWHRANPRVVRVQSNCDSAGMPPISSASPGLDVGTAQQGLRAEISFSAREAEQRLNWCAQDAAQLLLIQDWLLKQHEASK